MLFITDGLKGMKDTIHQIYPKAKYQHCCIHVSRNIAHKVRVSKTEKKSVMTLRLFIKLTQKKKRIPLSGMIEKWKKNYPKVTQSLIENQDLLTFYDFPPSIRRTIYSTNLIESFNKQIKRYSRRKEQFQNEESLERFLVSIFDTYNQKFLNRSHKGFQQVTDTLVSMFTE
uniref:Mutator family transposase n=1 Tax=Enterococcus faecium TaxID=1352 RepID=A0A455TW97_ENTFC|nr:IS256 family transposase [Enterococcus faecium]